MDSIVLFGLNHKTAPVQLRECIAFSKDEVDIALERLNQAPIHEVMLVSTCNRVEVLLTTDDTQKALELVKRFMAEMKRVPAETFENACYEYYDDKAVAHVFRVAASLDSMMVGEPQILGQIKQAYRTATDKNTSGVILNRLLHRAFFVAKKVRTETGIGDNAVSISYAAIELARKIFTSLDDKQVLLIGAGEMAEIAVEHLVRNRVSQIFVANRTFERGVALANNFNGQAVRFEEIFQYLKSVDIIISSTGASGYVVQKIDVKKVMRERKNRPLFFIDIAVPRDIDPEINKVSNAYVYDIDDLKGVVEENLEERKKEALKAERIVDEAVIRFRQWQESLDVIPTIVALRSKMDHIAEAELAKTLSSIEHLSEEERLAIHRMATAMINKIMHDPTLFLKGNGCHGEKSVYLDITRKLFNLDSI